MYCPACFTKDPCIVPADNACGCKFLDRMKCKAKPKEKEFTSIQR